MIGYTKLKTDRIWFAIVGSAVILTSLAACGSADATLKNPDNDQRLEFVDDSHVRYIGNYKDREWLYEADRSSNGEIIAMKMRHPDVGSFELRRNDDGCLIGDGLRFCP